MRLCVPGMGTILWGESPLYIIWKVSYMMTLKSTSRRQLRLCEERGEEAGVQICEPTHRNCIRPNRRASQHNMTKPNQITVGW